MSTSDPSDIVEQIDAVTEPGPDAATWIAAASDSESDTDPTVMHALLFGVGPVHGVTLRRGAPAGDIAALVGDPHVQLHDAAPVVGFWAGVNSPHRYARNAAANGFLKRLLDDVISGDCAASDADRDQARYLRASPARLPVIHGPCLVTGTRESSDGDVVPAPFAEAFRSWFGALVDELTEQAARDLLARLGISPADRDCVHIVVL